MANVLVQLSGEMAGLAESTRRSVVQVSNGRGGAGAGLIWSTEGLIVTNAHVVHHDAPQVTLPDGQRQTASVLAHDAGRDLALLSIRAHGLPAISLGDSSGLRAGDLVFAVGHPWGVEGAVSAGVVIGQGSDLPELGRANHEWLMVGLTLRPGNSGGPLVDVNGRLVGVNTIMTGPKVGGAVPVHVVKAFLDKALLN